jgi:hypothetical protein
MHNDDDATKPPNGFAPLAFEAEQYREHIADCELPAAVEAELLKALWAIIVGVVDMGLTIHPVQQAIEPRAVTEDNFLAAVFASVLGSGDNSQSNINDMAEMRPPAPDSAGSDS